MFSHFQKKLRWYWEPVHSGRDWQDEVAIQLQYASFITIIIIILIIFILNVIIINIIIIIIMYISSTTSHYYSYFLRWLYNHCTPFLLSLAIGEFTSDLDWIFTNFSTCALCFGIRSRLTIMSQHFHSMS